MARWAGSPSPEGNHASRKTTKRGDGLHLSFAPDTKRVFVAGEFNAWDPGQHRMVRARDGSFRARLRLAPGIYRHKSVADSTWIHDPDHPAAPNGFGTSDNVVDVVAQAAG